MPTPTAPLARSMGYFGNPLDHGYPARMSLWKRRKVEEEPEIDPAVERERMLRRTQWKRLQQHLADNPSFSKPPLTASFGSIPSPVRKSMRPSIG